MRWQTTAVVAVLLALVAGFYVYDVRYLGPARAKRESEKNRLWIVEPKDVEEVAVKRAKDTVRLRRTSDGWQMLEPLTAAGHRPPIDDLVTSLASAQMDREVAASPGALREFGLDAPAADITIRLKGKADPLGLQLGGTSPTGAWVYAKRRETPAVFLVSEILLRDTTKPASEFRDPAILAFDRKNVTGLELATRDDTIRLEQAEGKWRMTTPARLAADADVLTGFLDKLQFGKVKEFVADRPRSLGPYGLDRPARVAITVGADKDRSPRALLLGRVDPQKQGVYAMRPGESSVLLIDEEIWKLFPKNVAVLRDKMVIAFDREKLTRIELSSPRGAVTLARDGEQWKITAPLALPGDGPVIDGLVSRLRDLRAQAFLPDVRFTPVVKVSLWESGAAAPKVLTLAPSGERRGGQPSAYAAAGSGTVLIEARTVGELSKSAQDLRDHMFYSSLDHRDVKRVRVTADGKTALFERTGEVGWRMLEPKSGPAKGPQVEDVVVTVTALRWNDIVAEGGDMKTYGLDPPALSITLMKADGAELATVMVGKREGKQAYVRTKSPTVYTVDVTRLGTTPKVPDDFAG
jgi:hypothetical protein